MAHDPFHFVPITHTFIELLAVDDLIRDVLPSIDGMVLGQLSVSTRGITSGTATFRLKNLAGTVLATLSISAGGVLTTTPSPTPVASGETLRWGFSGIGIGLAGVSICQWISMPSHSR